MTAVAFVVVTVLVASVAFTLGRRMSTVDRKADVFDSSPVETVASVDDSTTAASVTRVAAATDTDRLLERLSQAVDQIEQGVIVCDANGADLFRNRVARRYAEARDGLVLVEAAVRELLVEALAGRSVRREVDLFGPPAQSYVITASPFSDGDEPGGLALVEDRSLRKRTETVRRDFVANISHELKTPIGALGLLAETIRDEPDREVVARLAERMITEADRAGCTVDDLLELSRIEFGDDAEFGEVQASGLVAEAVGRMASAAEQASIALRIEVDPTLVLFGDRRQLVSALYNLLDNAVKYSPPDSEIVVQAARGDEPTRARLSVTDSGIGIPRRDLDRVFERFYRVDRGRSRGTGGTGLGLAIVRHVASNHRGEVSLESTEGVGSTFALMLPTSAAPDQPPTGET